jgi:tetratricopeptide (TPR) repeat protein
MFNANSPGRLAFAPLLGNAYSDEARWLGAALAHLLSEHVLASQLAPMLSPNAVGQHMRKKGVSLPLEAEQARSVRNAMGLHGLIYGEYTLDEGSNSLGLRLHIASPEAHNAPLEAAAPLSSFDRYIDRVSLAVLTRLGFDVTAEVRERVAKVYRPPDFEAFRQVARARMAWAKGENELALAAVESALALVPQYEEAVALRIAIGREAGDTAAVVEAFRQWVDFARSRKAFSLAVERMLLLGHWMVERAEWGEARRAFRDASDLARRSKDEIGEARAKNNAAALDIIVDNPGPAIATMRRGLRALEEGDDAAETYFNLALAHKMQGQREEAIRALETAMGLARGSGDNNLQARIVAQRGTIRDDMGAWAEAMADYARAANLFDALGDDLSRAMVRAHQALLYRRQGMADRAEKIYLEALSTFEKSPHPPPYDQAVLWLNLADLYLMMERFDAAWDYASRAHAAFEQLDAALVTTAEALLEELTLLTAEEDNNEEEDLPSPPSEQTP